MAKAEGSEHAGSGQNMVRVGPGVPSHPNPVLASKTWKPRLKGRVSTPGSRFCCDNTVLGHGDTGVPPVLRPLEGLPFKDTEAHAQGCS